MDSRSFYEELTTIVYFKKRVSFISLLYKLARKFGLFLLGFVFSSYPVVVVISYILLRCVCVSIMCCRTRKFHRNLVLIRVAFMSSCLTPPQRHHQYCSNDNNIVLILLELRDMKLDVVGN